MSIAGDMKIGRAGEQAIDVARIDVSQFAGSDVILYTEQYPGRPLHIRVEDSADPEFTVVKSLRPRPPGTLAPGQRVVLQVVYKGQRMNIAGVLKQAGTEEFQLAFGPEVVPLHRRAFTRIDYAAPVRLAIISATTYRGDRLNRLRWLESTTANIGSAGLLLNFPTYLTNPTYLFLHIEAPEFTFPQLLLGQVLYSLPTGDGDFRVGLQFIVREAHSHHLSPATIKELPEPVREFNTQRRSAIDDEIQRWIQHAGKHLNKGATGE